MRIRGGTVAVAVLLAGTLAGCGNEAAQEAAERSPDPVVAAVGNTADEESARVAVSVQAGPETIGGEGVFDLADGDEGQLTVNLRQGQAMEVRVVDGEAFIRVPGLETQQPGKRWIRIDPDQAGTDPTQTMGLQNPVELIRLLESAADFQEAGPTSVRGDEATSWTGTLDLAALTSDHAAAERLRAMGLAELPAEVAIDTEDRLRRLAYTIDLAAVAQAAGEPLPAEAPQEMTFAVELFDFGADVDVEAPPAAEVTDAPPTGVIQ